MLMFFFFFSSPEPRDELACRMEQCIKRWVLGHESLIKDRAPQKPIPKAMPKILRRVEPEMDFTSDDIPGEEPIRKPPQAKKDEEKKEGEEEKEEKKENGEADNNKRKAEGDENG